MGSSPARPRGRHAAAPGALPALAVHGARGRHAAPSRVPVGAASAVVAATGALVVALPSTGAVTLQHAAAESAPAAAATPAPVALRAPSADTTARAQLAERASRSRRAPAVVVTTPLAPKVVEKVRPLLPGCTATTSTSAGYANGRLPDAVLCGVGSDERLRADAARAYAALSVAYRSRFGTAPCLIDGYRTLGEQQVLRRTKPRYAATPGMSEHGWGLAVDLGCGIKSSRSAEHAWMKANAPRFGWVHPDWAEPGGSRPEPWHWEYVPST